MCHCPAWPKPPGRLSLKRSLERVVGVVGAEEVGVAPTIPSVTVEAARRAEQ